MTDIWKSGWHMKIWLIYAPASDLESDRFWRAEVFAGDGTRFLTFRASFRVRRMFKWCEPPTCALTFELTFRAGEVNNSTNLRRRTRPLTLFLGTSPYFMICRLRINDWVGWFVIVCLWFIVVCWSSRIISALLCSRQLGWSLSRSKLCR